MKTSYWDIKSYKKLQINKDCICFIPHDYPKKDRFNFSHKIKRYEHIRIKNPYNRYKNKNLRKYVLLGIGGNVGNVLSTFRKLTKRLSYKNAIIAYSPFVKNPAFGYIEQDDFYNGIIVIKTSMCYADFFSYCMYLERIFGRARKRPFKNAPRSLDIDVLGFKNIFINLAHLQIPHKEWFKRESVLIPLKGIK